jgi:DNA polymerase-1
MDNILMVDGDIVLFQIGRVTEDITDFGDEQMESYDLDSAVRLIDNELVSISKKTGYKVDDIIFAISSATNFRKKHFPTYKGNRKNVKKPLGLKAMRQYMLDNAERYQTIMMEDLEADDLMGMYGTVPEGLDDNKYAIYSQDKDLFTIPCKQWCFKLRKFIYPNPLESVKFLYTQVLTGDSVDGYKGCPKIGKVKAARALDECTSEYALLEACHKLYFKVYGSDAKARLLEQIGQARILHYSDSQTLMKFDLTYDPYNLMSISDESVELWEESCLKK